MIQVRHLLSRSSCLLVLAIGAGLSPSLSAQQSVTHLPQSYLVSGRLIRNAFQGLAAPSSRSTVRILAEDDQVALGTVVAPDGWIITKASQLEHATRVELPGGQRLQFEFRGYHLQHDLALLKISADALTPIRWNFEAPDIGSWLVTVSPTADPVAVGVLSAARRAVAVRGRGVMGVTLESFEVPRIRTVQPHSGALAAGLREGDLVLKVNDQLVESGRTLEQTLLRYHAGDTVDLLVRREQEELLAGVRLARPFDQALAQISFHNQLNGPLSERQDGFAAVYQHDSVIRPEECGGPVIALDGKAVGINIARAGRVESYILPADLIVPLVDDMKLGKYPPPAPPLASQEPSPPSVPVSVD
ncbi:PDZ domain-containing protein [Planctomicrobium sp. SH664]|uniref:PDZ domain-containing protein n=1 Tax=Planctomicrobium sp. SH664 TaxID=3448125 RepID=UPI003F5CA260